MKIAIVGDGKVGFALACQLNQEGHDVTIIENKQKVLEDTVNRLDIIGVLGNGASVDVLVEAGVKECELLIAVTSQDEINIICCMLAKKLGTKNTIARIRNPEYVAGLNMMKEDLGLSMQINPEMAAALEIVRSLRFSSTIKATSFAKGRVELTEIKIREGSALIGKNLMEISSRYKSNVLFCVVQRGSQIIIPDGQTIIQENDKVSLTGSMRELEQFFKEIKLLKDKKVEEVMIVGGGRISFYLIRLLLHLGIEVKVVEMNKDVCLQLVEKFPSITVIHGDGTDHELLRSENLEDMDGFIALTDNDEENVIISMFASSLGVQNVLPKVNRVSLGFLLEKLGLENAITPKNITANQICQYVRAMQNSVGSNIESLIKIVDDQVEVLEFRVRKNCKFIGVPLKDLTFKKEMLVAYITRKGKPQIAQGDSYVEIGDTLILISKIAGLRDINDVLA
ncbi:Trk system potassium transporter TrkA [Faecalicoccus pleomorphus]|uniref:Trk system potassium transporter TrkA n=1 Tax=Faecalicoccus pleomorphus TaxID=1323 RepID=UPI00195FAC39|nr:Trk system potassium transporter TrkA [Faecalicoccus pleomorphus]MBM6764627.1 Trk system potassium transporter TrkA [Faecalicoccus pleomorphus]MDB7986306.1 Trk system potassium transporter TrkA [Faecalicoccus pleomorphus]MDB7990246.1 Trk system potassium transporter TrkA [Faecalicoccus pleomorphus]MDM8292405.1 Trk system potassium transporter TrkA [Faecalicoccus pleomorphus]